MDKIEQLKNEEPLDLWVIAMLYFGMTPTQISRKHGISRAHIYKIRERSKQLLLMYHLLDITK